RETDDSRRCRPEPSVLSALSSPRLLTRGVLAGLVVGLALIPEAIAFSIIAGVDPRVGLFSAFIMATSIAFLGGRPAMISAATGRWRWSSPLSHASTGWTCSSPR